MAGRAMNLTYADCQRLVESAYDDLCEILEYPGKSGSRRPLPDVAASLLAG